MGVKLRKMRAKQFYLSVADTQRAIELCEDGSITSARALVDFIDEHGEWLD